MKRIAIVIVVLAAAIAAYLTLQDKPSLIAVENAKATTMMDGTVVIGLGIRNGGGPDELLGASSPTGETVAIVNPEMGDVPLIVPGRSPVILASDGVHLTLTGAEWEEGAFLPITLNFKNAGDVATRVENAGEASMMMHALANGIDETPAPRLSISPVTAPSADGFEIALQTENFSFLKPDEGAPHVSGEGHGHVYLNGLKLGRAYADIFKVGALPSGKYTLTVGLYANSHQPYFNAGSPVSTSLVFDIP